MTQHYQLVLTPLSLGTSETHLLFLGEWAVPIDYGLKEGDVVLPYHWKNREKFYKDYAYLLDLQERLLPALSDSLNRIHKTSHSVHYWRMIAGVWLGYFTQILFDRWESLSSAHRMYPISTCLTLDHPFCAPPHLDAFRKNMVTDWWNQALFETLLPYFDINSSHSDVPPKSKKEAPKKISFQKRVSYFFLKLTHLFVKETEPFFFATQLPILSLILVQMRLGIVPRLWTSEESLPEISAVASQRQWQLDLHPKTPFEKALFKLIPLQIPTLYVEGFPSIQHHSKRLPWPKKPPFIFTCSAQCQHELFKVWAAEKCESGSRLIIGQHGGGYGQQRVCFHEDHEKAIYDAYLSWGWTDPNEPRIQAGPLLKLLGNSKQGKWNPNGWLLSVQHGTPPYSYWLYTSACSSLWLDYFKFQCSFISGLSERVQSQTVLRLYTTDFGWNAAKRFLSKFPHIKQDSRTKFSKLLAGSRLVVCTYNGTTHLESLAQNIPTLIIWDPTYEELRQDAAPYYAVLREAGIFHTNAQEAAAFVEKIWDHIELWWESQEVKKAKKLYSDRFCASSPEEIAALCKQLKRLSGAN